MIWIERQVFPIEPVSFVKSLLNLPLVLRPTQRFPRLWHELQVVAKEQHAHFGLGMPALPSERFVDWVVRVRGGVFDRESVTARFLLVLSSTQFRAQGRYPFEFESRRLRVARLFLDETLLSASLARIDDYEQWLALFVNHLLPATRGALGLSRFQQTEGAYFTYLKSCHQLQSGKRLPAMATGGTNPRTVNRLKRRLARGLRHRLINSQVALVQTAIEIV